ncbi:MAG TPA: hypothetical protein DD621_01495 [Clostridiales bacterium]|nr:hypothetical protein [Clostridiales bacterium]
MKGICNSCSWQHFCW